MHQSPTVPADDARYSGERRSRAKPIAAGASEYVTKPVDISRFPGLMRSWLERRQSAEGSG
jgi:DNA-binding response OmpR family regulator